MKAIGSLCILFGVVFVFMGISGIASVDFNSSSGTSVDRSDGIFEDIVSILISTALIVGGYGILKRTKWAYWCVLVVMAAVVFVFVVQGVYIALTFESLSGRLWGLASQWVIAWLIFHFLIRGYWPKKKEYDFPRSAGSALIRGS